MIKIISASNISYVSNGNVILDKIDFDIEKGTFVSIVGSNGSGKSCLVKALAGIINSNGYININGSFLDKNNIVNIRRDVGIVFGDDYNSLLGESVLNDLVINLENIDLDRKEISKRLDYIIREFKLENILNKQIRDLSNSEKEKVFIASAVINNPSVLILDDCLHQLSVKDKKLVFSVLNRYKKNNKMTIIMVTHDMEDAILSDRVIVMYKGRIVKDGSPISVFKDKKKLNQYGVSIPFCIDLSLRLIDKGLIENVYVDKRKLVDVIWK